jgi:hypothetical protein
VNHLIHPRARAHAARRSRRCARPAAWPSGRSAARPTQARDDASPACGAISPLREDDGSGSADTDDNDAGDGGLRCRVHRGLQREAGGPTHVRDGAARLPLRLPNRPNQPDERRLIARICAVPRQSGLVGPRLGAGAARLWGFESLRPHSIVPTGRSDARLPAASPTSCATGSGRSAARRWSDRQPPDTNAGDATTLGRQLHRRPSRASCFRVSSFCAPRGRRRRRASRATSERSMVDKSALTER